MHETYNPKMRWEIAKRRESNSSALGKLSELSGSSYPQANHNMDTEVKRMNFKSQTTVASAEMDKVVTSPVRPSDDNGKNVSAMGTVSSNKMVAETDSNENETTVCVTNNRGSKEQNSNEDEVNLKDLSSRQEKQEELSDDDNSSDDSGEDRCELPKKPALKDNTPSVSISDVEIKLEELEITCSETRSIEGQLKKLAISPSGTDKGGLSERSPVGNERPHRHNYNPYAIASKVLYNGGGIVAEAPVVPDILYSDPSAIMYHNITDSAESSNYYSMLPPSPEFPFGQESSSPPRSPMPDVEQVDLDAWLNDNCKVDEEIPGKMKDSGELEFPEITDTFAYLDSLTSDFINIPPEQHELSSDLNCSYTLSHFPLTYRQVKSIPSISSPSSGSHYSSCSPLSSPAPSPGDSVASKSDSDTEYEMTKIELSLKEGITTPCNASLHSAQVVKSSSQNEFLPHSPVCSLSNHYSLILDQTISLQATQPAISVQSAPQQVQLAPSKNIQNVFIQNNVQSFTYAVPQQPNIQRGPVVPNIVTASARERIAAKLNKRVKDAALLAVAKLTDEQLSKGDEHGDTQLMILIVNNHPQKLECIFALVNTLKHISGALEARNVQNQSALLLACLFLPHMPFVARFIAEVMGEKDIPVNEVYDDGNTLLHLLCEKGDSHVDVLAELLSMRDLSNCPCFDVNQYNYTEGAPLHMAVKTHSRKTNCSRTIAFLLSQGANVRMMERSSGQTALHMAIKESCDPLLVQILLQAAERININLVNEGDYRGDTALHYAALRNDVLLHQQLRVIQLLVRYGAVSNRCGSQGKTPLALVSAERKNEIQKIIHKR